jgi:hypothetical protein
MRRHCELLTLMAHEDKTDSLVSSKADYVASAAKAALGAVPFVGPLLVEIAGTVIPHQRIDRIVEFAGELEKRIADLEHATARAQITDENFADLIEEALRQAARAVSAERRLQIASLVANSLTSEEVSFIESKHLLRILGEINDIEVIWLRFFLHPIMGGDDAFRAKHKALLQPARAHLGSSQQDLDKHALQESYKEHLAQLGLLRENFKVDPKTKTLSVDNFGKLKRDGFEITALGRLLLRQVGLQ